MFLTDLPHGRWYLAIEPDEESPNISQGEQHSISGDLRGEIYPGAEPEVAHLLRNSFPPSFPEGPEKRAWETERLAVSYGGRSIE